MHHMIFLFNDLVKESKSQAPVAETLLYGLCQATALNRGFQKCSISEH
jgi:hypothetical protein